LPELNTCKRYASFWKLQAQQNCGKKVSRRKKEEGRRKKEEGRGRRRRKKEEEEGRRKREEGRRKKEEEENYPLSIPSTSRNSTTNYQLSTVNYREL
jgi:hypothetical protein